MEEAANGQVSECLDEASRCLSIVGANLAGLLQDLGAPPACLAPQLQHDLDRLEKEVRILSGNLEGALEDAAAAARTPQQRPAPPPPPPPQRSGMAERCAEVEELRSKVLALQSEYDKCAAQLTSAQADATCLRSQLTNQSVFCASLGSVLGNLLWKASRVPPVVDLLLSGNKATDFICIVSGTLESFLETFNTEMPNQSSDESQFIMAMGGIVTNMAAAPAGRQFLVSDPNGRDLIQQIVRVLPVIPTPSGNCLKRLLLMALYNVSINQAGLNLLQDDGGGAIFSVAKNCLKPESPNELKVMALRLLHSLTCEIKSPALIAQVPKHLISDLASSDDPQIQSLAQDVNENLLKAQERLVQTPNKSIGVNKPQGLSARSPPALSESDNVENRQPVQPTAAWRLPSHQ
ncbi:Heat shock factor 2-binding protein [Frankliniella fusca]|uniref:Heat shock factor 2-binding protein n=1 Tax=Frankliniella fusca TaxID=407009 RepID=A0AAE1LTQ3_9NEOP|nr:Heat shock factor 2-binding protein [Frankliniella fusca]